MEHPNTQLLRALIQNNLDEDEAATIEQHLAHCPDCQQAYETLVQLMTGYQQAPLESPESSTTEKLLAAFRQKQNRLTDRLRQTAVLEFDSWAGQPVANFRGQIVQRQILLTQGAVDIDLQIDPKGGNERFHLQGQILMADDPDANLTGLQVRLSDAEGEEWWGLTDKNGRFSFLQLHYGTYDIQLILHDQDIIFEQLQITT